MTIAQPDQIGVYYPIEKKDEWYFSRLKTVFKKCPAISLFQSEEKGLFPALTYSISLKEWGGNEKEFQDHYEIQGMLKNSSRTFFYGTESKEVLLRTLDEETSKSYGLGTAQDVLNMKMILASYGEIFDLNYEEDDHLNRSLDFFKDYQQLLAAEKAHYQQPLIPA